MEYFLFSVGPMVQIAGQEEEYKVRHMIIHIGDEQVRLQETGHQNAHNRDGNDLLL